MPPREPPRELLAALLAALERGTVSAEEALRESLRGTAQLARWVKRKQRAWDRALVRRPTVRKTGPVQEKFARAAVAAAKRRYLSQDAVISVHWGLAREEGRSTSCPGVVVVVGKKLPEDAIEHDQRIDRTLNFRFGGSRRRVRVDVQGVSGPGVLRGARPGRNASVTVNGQMGTVGALIQRGAVWYAVLSGHVARTAKTAATATTVDGTAVSLGRVERVVLSAEADAASAGPIADEDVERLAPQDVQVRELGTADLNVAIRILVARDIVPRKTFVTEVGATAPFRYRDGIRNVHGLIGTSHDVTVAGDSGAPAVDFEGNLVGFLLGSYDGRSYLVPAGRTLEELAS